MAKFINEKDLEWVAAAHEDPEDPGALKKVIVGHGEVDKLSKLMMVNLCNIPVGKAHQAHSHQTMEEIFYFTAGTGSVIVDGERFNVKKGDRIIIPAKSTHQVINEGDIDLLYIGIGIGLD